MARRGYARAALLATLGCAVATGASAATQSAGGSAPAPPSPTVSANQRAAVTRAAWLITQVPLPPGATSQPTEPQGDDSLLAHPASGPPATPNVTDDHAWWLAPGSPAEAVAYVRTHLPSGTRIGSSGQGLSGPGVPRNYSISIAWPSVPEVLAGGLLVIQAVQLG